MSLVHQSDHGKDGGKVQRKQMMMVWTYAQYINDLERRSEDAAPRLQVSVSFQYWTSSIESQPPKVPECGRPRSSPRRALDKTEDVAVHLAANDISVLLVACSLSIIFKTSLNAHEELNGFLS
jgi:hypothetical protein